MRHYHLSTGGRYPVLRALGIIYLFMGGIAVVSGIVAAFWERLRAPMLAGDRIVLAVGTLTASFFLCVLMLGVAEVIKLAMDIEYNTRVAGGAELHPAVNDTSTTAATGPRSGRMSHVDEESAEAALLRGH